MRGLRRPRCDDGGETLGLRYGALAAPSLVEECGETQHGGRIRGRRARKEHPRSGQR